MNLEKNTLRVNGVVTYWSLSEGLSLDSLRDNCPDWFNKMLPEETAPLGALKRVLTRRIQGKAGLYLRPVARDGYAIMQEHEAAGKKAATERGRMLLLPLPDGGVGLAMTPFHEGVFADLVKQWQQERRRITASALGTALSRAVLSARVKGVSLRPSGGIYWVSDNSCPEWEALATGIETSGPASVYRMGVAHDAESVRAICDNLTAHVEKEMEQVNEALTGGDLGKRGQKTQKRRARSLEELVSHVEETLEITLLGLRQKTTEIADVAVLETFLEG